MESSTQTALREKIVIVTGGGGGLGAALCQVLSSAGATVIAADLQVERAQQVAQKLAAQGARATACALDTGSAERASLCVRNVVQQHGRLDILINNAGVDVTLPIDELRVDQWDRVLATNLSGPFFMTKFAVPHMKARKGGHIVNISSTAARRAWPNASAYHASKWGLLGLSHALHAELRPFGIKVTAVIAGGMRTPFLLERFPDIDPATLQDPLHVATVIRDVLCAAGDTVVPEVSILPLRETSWP